MNIFSKLKNVTKFVPKKVALLFGIVAAVVVPAAIFAAQGPVRYTFTMETPADHIVFNSITDNTAWQTLNGTTPDERDFVMAKLASDANVKKLYNNITVQDNTDYLVYMYIHNNAAPNLNLVANNVKAWINIPTDAAKQITAQGVVTSSNADPTAVYDDVNFTSNENFTLSYVKGSAKYYNNAGTFAIPDSVVNNMATFGYDKMDGNIPGCIKYAGWLVIKVHAKMENPAPKVPGYDLAKTVDKTTAKPGDTLNYTLKFTNTGETKLTNVVIKDNLPAGLQWVNTLNVDVANGDGITDQDKLFGTGVKVAYVNPGGTVTVTFQAKVAADAVPATNCGANSKVFTNTASATTTEDQTEDNANNNSATTTVTVNKDCNYSYDLIKTVDKTTAKPGDTLTYTLTFKNTGNQPLANVIVKDALPNGVNYVAGSTTVDGAKKADGVTTANGLNIGTVAAGKTVVIKFQATIAANVVAKPATCGQTASVNLVNTASVKTDNKTDQANNADEDNASNNSATTTVTVKSDDCQPKYDIAKTVDKKTAQPGDTVKYTLTFKNTGNQTLTNVIVKDAMPTGVTLSGAVTTNPSTGVSGDLFSDAGLKIAQVEVGKTVVITFNAKIASADQLACGKTVFTNVVAAGASELAKEPDTSNNSAVTTVTKDCPPAPKPCPTNPSISVDDPNCKPCPYNPEMNFDNPNCVPPVTPPVNPPAPTPTPTPVYTPENIVATGPTEFVAAVLAAGALTFGVVAYIRSRQAVKTLHR